MHWAWYEGENYEPKVVWTTPYLGETERNVAPCLTLTRFLPEPAQEYVFGKTVAVNARDATPKNAAKLANSRKVPALSVYVLLPNAGSQDGKEMVEERETDISYLFRDVPVRMLRLQSDQFFANTNSPQSILSTDRAAALYGAMQKHGAPVLVVDAKDCITYTAIGKNSKLLGGGIGSGLSLRFSALADFPGVESFPQIDRALFSKTLKDASDQKTPLSLFAADPAPAMIGAAASEIAGSLRRIAKCFIETQKKHAGNGVVDNDKQQPVTVVITGSDAAFIQQILRADCSHVVVAEPGAKFPSEAEMKVVVEKNLTPFGISKLLHNESKKSPALDEIESVRNRVLGLRGAKAESFVTNLENSPGVYRGTFVRFVRGKSLEEDSYEIVFDNDGEKELLNIVELYDALALYGEAGETSEDDTKRFSTDEKQQELKAIQKVLVATSAKVSGRKEVLDAMKESEGSIASILGIPAAAKRGKKRGRNPNLFTGDAREYINQRVAKWFDDDLYFGTIKSISHQGEGGDVWWHVLYDDDDQEDFDVRQLRKGLKDYEENQSSDPKNKAGKTPDP
ncbi:MAG: hypothetical protein SGILL_001733 [Bacillariaceae sp.]